MPVLLVRKRQNQRQDLQEEKNTLENNFSKSFDCQHKFQKNRKERKTSQTQHFRKLRYLLSKIKCEQK